MATKINRKAASTNSKTVRQQRRFFQESKQEAVQMLSDGHSAVSVAELHGLHEVTLSGPSPSVEYKSVPMLCDLVLISMIILNENLHPLNPQ